MSLSTTHTFHIPVMGLGYTIDTPVKVARFGISSVISIIEDHLIEQMREFYCHKYDMPYEPIRTGSEDHRAKRITAYLNLINEIVNNQFEHLKTHKFGSNTELDKYFELLPDNSPLKISYQQMLLLPDDSSQKKNMQAELRAKMRVGSIDVNIMTKCDSPSFTKEGVRMPDEFSDAHAALRGYALSDLCSSIIFSAGLNPKLYSYSSTFKDFYPDANGEIKKKIVLKVSDYRSAYIQGKFLVNKGLWISEFRIESGLNCGGHAFATEGLLLGPILQEFKDKKHELQTELTQLYTNYLSAKRPDLNAKPNEIKITVQGGIGTRDEDAFLLKNYNLDGTGWGSPFLLVPEATNVDAETLQALVKAKKEDYFLSHSSPLGIPFNNFRNSSSEKQRKERIVDGKPGSPCYKKFLAFSNEFTDKPICLASRQYIKLKIDQLSKEELNPKQLAKKIELIEEKDCLCEGLGSGVLLKNNLKPSHKLTAVSICPGPNLAYFSKVMSLEELVNHIYGRANVLNSLKRPHVFINELSMYVDYLKKEIDNYKESFQAKKQTYLDNFKQNLKKGIDYYEQLVPEMKKDFKDNMNDFSESLKAYSKTLSEINIPVLQ